MILGYFFTFEKEFYFSFSEKIEFKMQNYKK